MSETTAITATLGTKPSYRRRRGWIITGLIVSAVALLLSGLTLLRASPLQDIPGAYGDDLRGVMTLIHEENQRVLREHPGEVVTLAELLPLSGDYTDIAMTRASVRHALEGAYLAQRWRNQELKAVPYIRLMVGSIGPDDWAATARAVRDEKVVAVTGLGASIQATTDVITSLSEKPPVPMVAAVITSDELQKQAGLTRVAPLNSAEAAGGVWKAGKRDADFKAIIVADAHATDSYSRTLNQSYERLIETGRLLDKLSFDSSAKAAGAVLGNVADKICDSEATTVFYTGRTRDLPQLLNKLAQSRKCASRDLTVITGDDAAELDPAQQGMRWSDNGGRIALYYTALANPSLEEPALPALRDRFKSEAEDSFYNVFRNESLDDAQAIMHHDTVLVAIKAIDEYAAQQPGGGWKDIGPAEVIAMLRSGTISVDGASGPIDLSKDGNPVSKGFPVLRLLPSGITTDPVWYPG